MNSKQLANLLKIDLGSKRSIHEIDDCTSREAHSCNRYHELRPGNKRSLTSWAMGIQRIVQEN
ncbi:MAG: hypothetical protein ACLQBD_31800, partial [Syntrophobacteraceae bacterium]